MLSNISPLFGFMFLLAGPFESSRRCKIYALGTRSIVESEKRCNQLFFKRNIGSSFLRDLIIALTSPQFLSGGCGIFLIPIRVEFSSRPDQWRARRATALILKSSSRAGEALTPGSLLGSLAHIRLVEKRQFWVYRWVSL